MCFAEYMLPISKSWKNILGCKLWKSQNFLPSSDKSLKNIGKNIYKYLCLVWDLCRSSQKFKFIKNSVITSKQQKVNKIGACKGDTFASAPHFLILPYV